jgi:hypothetical protein
MAKKQSQVYLGFYAPADLALALSEKSSSTEHSISWLLRKALEAYLVKAASSTGKEEVPRESLIGGNNG